MSRYNSKLIILRPLFIIIRIIIKSPFTEDYAYPTDGAGHAKMCLMPYANNKGADQPVHPCSLISTFVVRCLDSMICILALSKCSRF